MGANSAISWTTHTLNPWIGCAKVSAGCANCYAEALMDSRYKRVKWGKDGTRSKTRMLAEVPKWNAAAKKAGERHRVFCASLADVFEDFTAQDGSKPLDAWRAELWPVILACTNLDFLLLTKRPENVCRMMPHPFMPTETHFDNWPAHVWLGTSVENQATADERIPHLLRTPAKVKFLSCEPLLGPVVLRMPDVAEWPNAANQIANGKETCDWRYWMARDNGVSWVIAGTESGARHRDASLDWVRSLRDQCKQGGVPFFVKQLPSGGPKPLTDPADFPEDLRIQEVPNEPMRGAVRHLASSAVQQRA
jgi:protein gp37